MELPDGYISKRKQVIRYKYTLYRNKEQIGSTEGENIKAVDTKLKTMAFNDYLLDVNNESRYRLYERMYERYGYKTSHIRLYQQNKQGKIYYFSYFFGDHEVQFIVTQTKI